MKNRTIHEVNKPKENDSRILIIRFPNGEWSYGGKPKDYSDYDEIEFFWVWQNTAYNCSKAVKKAQSWRSRNRKKENVNAN